MKVDPFLALAGISLVILIALCMYRDHLVLECHKKTCPPGLSPVHLEHDDMCVCEVPAK